MVPLLAAIDWAYVSVSTLAGGIALVAVWQVVVSLSRPSAGFYQPPVRSADATPDSQPTPVMPSVQHGNYELNHPIIFAPPKPLFAADEKPGPKSSLDSIRELLGPTPRAFDASLAGYLNVNPPGWLENRPRDELWQQYRRQQSIRANGAVGWAAMVQVNAAMFVPDMVDLAGSFLYTTDPYYEQQPNELLQMADDIFALKGTDQADSEADAFARMLTLEISRGMRLKVPRRFSHGRDVWHSAMMLPRKHLPRGFITGSLLPVWVEPGDSGVILPIPAAYWPSSLLMLWALPQTQPNAG